MPRTDGKALGLERLSTLGTAHGTGVNAGSILLAAEPSGNETNTEFSSDLDGSRKARITYEFNYSAKDTIAGRDPLDEGPVLHRSAIIRYVGKPLWEYETSLHCIKGCVAVVSSLERLASLDILHGDINPGNVLLATEESPQKDNEGFLSDLEFLYIPVMRDTVPPRPTERLPEHVARRDGTLVAVDQTANQDIQVHQLRNIIYSLQTRNSSGSIKVLLSRVQLNSWLLRSWNTS